MWCRVSNWKMVFYILYFLEKPIQEKEDKAAGEKKERKRLNIYKERNQAEPELVERRKHAGEND